MRAAHASYRGKTSDGPSSGSACGRRSGPGGHRSRPAQAGSGLRPVVACPPGGPLAREAAKAGAEVHDWHATRAPGRGWPRGRRARRIVRASRPHVVHAHSAKAGLAGRVAVRGRVPRVPAARLVVRGGRRPHRRSGSRWERFGPGGPITSCASANPNAAPARRRASPPAGRSSTTASTSTASVRQPRGSGRGPRRAALPRDADRDAPLVVCVGRLTRQKGQDVLLRAWRRTAVPGARLVLVGDGPDRKALEEAAPPGVLFTGACADVRPWLHAADVLVLPSAGRAWHWPRWRRWPAAAPCC